MMFCKRCNSCKGSSLVEGKLGREMFHHSHQSVRCKTSGLSVKKHLRQKFCRPSLRNCQNQGRNPSKKLVIREWHSVTFYFKKYSWAPLILTIFDPYQHRACSKLFASPGTRRCSEEPRSPAAGKHPTLSRSPHGLLNRGVDIFPSALSMTTPLSLGPANFWICARKISSTKSGGLGDTWTRPIIGWP